MSFTRLFVAALTITAMVACTNAFAGKPGGKFRTAQSTQNYNYQNNFQYNNNQKLRLQNQHSLYTGQSSSSQYAYSQSGSNQYRLLQPQQKFNPKPQCKPTQHSYATQSYSTQSYGKVPQFGFHSQFGSFNGQGGEYVTQVNYGSHADKLGLKQRDIILAVNGQSLRTSHCWDNHIRKATNHDGWVTLKIRDSRTGSIAYQTANLLKN